MCEFLLLLFHKALILKIEIRYFRTHIIYIRYYILDNN